ncbi:MAG: hypothetical protein GX660_23735 [Clostridiaceae bacterium]|nr:hypothetical protein [Clostridiaceae bacterium]
MKTGKSQVLMLVVLSVVLYGFIFYNFIWLKSKPEIEDIKASIDKKTEELNQLKRDFANIENLKRSLNMKKVQNERLEEYLMSDANITDSIEYIDKLSKLFDSDMSGIQISKPTSLTSTATGTPYYQFGITLQSTLSYDKIMDMVDYIEGGTRKVSISNFEIAYSQKGTEESNQKKVANAPENNIDLNMTVNIYSISSGSADKLYQYSTKKFNTHRESDGVIFVPKADSSGGTGNAGTIGGRPASEYAVNSGHSAGNSDIRVVVESFLAAGENFWVYGNGNEMTPVRYKTKTPVDVKLTFSDSSYSVYAKNDTGLVQEINGGIQGEEIDLFLKSNFLSNVAEDRNLGANISIINNSNKRIMVTLNDQPKRIRLKDRNGKAITRQNETEKLFIL